MNVKQDLECTDLVKKFGAFTAVDGVSLSALQGSFFSILGPSGCGKTTLLRMIAGFQSPDAGDIRIKGRSVLDVAPNRRNVNMIFQHLALFPMMTVAENVAYGLQCHGTPKAEIGPKVAAALARVDLPDAGPKRIDQLSGGQKQRIAIARCLVLEPDLLLLDEPLGALDLKLREHMKVELKQLQQKIGTTFVYITHDQSEALVMSDQVAVMNHGRFEQIGSPQELYYDPRTAFVAGFVGDANRWRGRIESGDAKSAKVVTGDGLALTASTAGNPLSAGAEVVIFVRPESISLTLDEGGVADLDNRLSGQVENLLFNGANSTVQVRDSRTGGEVMVRMPQTAEFANLAHGAPVYLGWNDAQAKCFPAGEDSPPDEEE
jgi:spermidine/putrescine transport system ATP-binding protein